jgi:hypothetical protein
MRSATRRLTWGYVNVLDTGVYSESYKGGGIEPLNERPVFNPWKMLNKTLVFSLFIILTNGQTYAYAASTYSQDIWKLYMHNRVVNEKQYNCINKLWTIESHWNNKSKNKRSTAYGIAQVLGTKTSDPFKQIDAGLKYIGHRYSNDGCKALAHHKKVGHY